MACSNKRKPLLQWMEDGDPERMPVLMASAQSTAASYFGTAAREEGRSSSCTLTPEALVTPDMITRCSRETGMFYHVSLGSAGIADAVEFMKGVEQRVSEETGEDGTVRRTTLLRTPSGDLKEVFVTPWNKPACWQENFVKNDADLPALTYLLENAAEEIVSNPRVKDKITARLSAEATRWPADAPTFFQIGVPAFVLTSNQFAAPDAALYLLADQTERMEKLFAIYARMNDVFLDCAAEAGADFAMGAINGLEIYSPAIYAKYFIPQAQSLYEAVRDRGMKSWLHTCGRMNRLIESGVYERMMPDVVESLSHPPLGDVGNLCAARERLGSGIVTRGGVNVSLFYNESPEDIRHRTREVLAATRGYRHMIGDTNDSFPPYPRETILAMLDEIRNSGRMLSA